MCQKNEQYEEWKKGLFMKTCMKEIKRGTWEKKKKRERSIESLVMHKGTLIKNNTKLAFQNYKCIIKHEILQHRMI